MTQQMTSKDQLKKSALSLIGIYKLTLFHLEDVRRVQGTEHLNTGNKKQADYCITHCTDRMQTTRSAREHRHKQT